MGKQQVLQTTRARVIRRLIQAEQAESYVGLMTSEAEPGEEREERLFKEYLAGITRWKKYLDFLISRFYKGNAETLESGVRQVLRLGLYDILFLHTPAHAALHEAVELAKHFVRPGAGGLVNGILRNVLRSMDRLPEPDTGNPAVDLAMRYSHPEWIVTRWLVRFGYDETLGLLHWNNERPYYGLRINRLNTSVESVRTRLDELEVEWEPSPYLDDFVRVKKLQPVLHSELLTGGLCAVQDESAGLIVRLLDPQPGETIWDACAAPGGKTTYAVQRMNGTGRVFAFDLHPSRLPLIDKAAKTQQAEIISTVALDARSLPDQPDLFGRPDRILVDAPCSGLGVLSKRADLRWNRKDSDLDDLTTLQAELLDHLSLVLAPGSLLVYSTCTIEPEENVDIIQSFLRRHPDFGVEPASGYIPDELISPEGFFASYPQRHGIDGAFGARLRKKSI